MSADTKQDDAENDADTLGFSQTLQGAGQIHPVVGGIGWSAATDNSGTRCDGSAVQKSSQGVR